MCIAGSSLNRDIGGLNELECVTSRLVLSYIVCQNYVVAAVVP